MPIHKHSKFLSKCQQSQQVRLSIKSVLFAAPTYLSGLIFLPMICLMCIVCLNLVGCGFQLRTNNTNGNLDIYDINNHRLGPQAHQSFNTASLKSIATSPKLVISLKDNRDNQKFRQTLNKKFSVLGIQTLAEQEEHHTPHYNHISIDNIQFKQYELEGILTEKRVIIYADVTYQFKKNGENMIKKHPIQVERSYQFNAASVSVDNLQAQQIKTWLYDTLARRISDQYVALILSA